MAKKSKTQRAKASAARQQRKAARENADIVVEEVELTPEETKKLAAQKKKDEKEEAKALKKAEKKTKKPNRVVQFFKDVRSEMKRVTWPTRKDVGQWTGVVIVALLFFGIFVAVLDNIIITPILVGISGIGA